MYDPTDVTINVKMERTDGIYHPHDRMIPNSDTGHDYRFISQLEEDKLKVKLEVLPDGTSDRKWQTLASIEKNRTDSKLKSPKWIEEWKPAGKITIEAQGPEIQR